MRHLYHIDVLLYILQVTRSLFLSNIYASFLFFFNFNDTPCTLLWTIFPVESFVIRLNELHSAKQSSLTLSMLPLLLTFFFLNNTREREKWGRRIDLTQQRWVNNNWQRYHLFSRQTHRFFCFICFFSISATRTPMVR